MDIKLDLNGVPEVNNFTKVLFYLRNNDINWRYYDFLKEVSSFSDDVLSNWFHVTAKTFRSYRKPNITSKKNAKEHLILLISLYKHGIDVFGKKEQFDNWLNKENILLDHIAPKEFLDTVTGIKFIDNRLTSIEYGDNV
jgi:uncharacterized protein (DUF2384 family)